ncbi:MAG: hypothetical protein AAF871_05890 [Pseudomonadota bacterium]
MEKDWVVLRLPPPLLASLITMAKDSDKSPGQILRDYLAREARKRQAAGPPEPLKLEKPGSDAVAKSPRPPEAREAPPAPRKGPEGTPPAIDMADAILPEGCSNGSLSEMIETAIEAGVDWAGLQNSLTRTGVALRPRGLGLAIHTWPDDRFVCKSGDLGFSFAELIRRLGRGEPPDPSRIVPRLAS